MPDYLRMGFILMVVGMVATAILAATESATREPIAEAKRQETLRMLRMVLPPGFDNEPVNDTVTLADKKLNRKEKPVIFYRARKGTDASGVAYIVTAPDGYSGDIEIMMSVLPTGMVHLVQIVAQNETPGLGDKILPTKTDWLRAFVGKNRENTRWRVKKDGGDFDQFAGATITPRAVVHAVKRGLDFFVEKKELIFQPATVEKKP
ncbi:MAG: RnfABCDGE type electron transport complex subunit G [Magnetococcales bacterium]|nr:RnfABCDGE type electron transport complex subunit G [Magnetococcales bacterium]MBF0116857.1 RnfABCDGE type electron transport complex subunit G [Magnetococcales bacterium]